MTQLLDRKIPEEDMGQFLREIRSFPRLTEEEERDLARRCAEGDEEAIRRMEGIQCGFKGTSCPDQLARALKEALSAE